MSLDRSSPRRGLRNASQTSLPSPTDGGRLSVIAEDGDVPPVPQIPTKSYCAPFSRRWNMGDPPRHSFEKPPPKYSLRDVTGPKAERLLDFRNNKYIVRRGGWKRLLVLVLFAIAVIIALAVGLTIGLRKDNSNSNSTAQPGSTASPPSTPTGAFPIGTYALNTFLDTVSTACTSNPVTWLCYPYSTYAQSPTAAFASFNWIISGSQNNYFISSSNNPFAINFVNASLKLVDANSPNERYMFSVPINKTVIPSASITTDNSMATCQYNTTQFQASLYTRLSNTYPPNSTAASSTSASTIAGSSASGGIQTWPYAVQVTQSIGGGVNVPACYEVKDGNLGFRITEGLDPQLSRDICSCIYKNYDP